MEHRTHQNMSSLRAALAKRNKTIRPVDVNVRCDIRYIIDAKLKVENIIKKQASAKKKTSANNAHIIGQRQTTR